MRTQANQIQRALGILLCGTALTGGAALWAQATRYDGECSASTGQVVRIRGSNGRNVQVSGNSRVIHNDEMTMVWTEGGRTVVMQKRGEVEFSEDRRGILRMPAGSRFMLEERLDGENRCVIVTAAAGGLQHSYFVNGEAAAYDAAARDWFARGLWEALRESGIDAPERTARIFAREGTRGVLREIEEIHSNSARQAYYRALIENHEIPPRDLASVLDHLSSRIRSDGDASSLLKRIVERHRLEDNAARAAFFRATEGINSDGDHTSVLLAVVGQERLPAVVVADAIRSASGINSDGDKTHFLTRVAERHSLADERVRTAFFEIARSIRSDGDLLRVLSAVLRRQGTDQALVLEVLRAAPEISSDGDMAHLLMRVPATHLKNRAVETAFLEAMKTINSDGDRSRVALFLLENRA